jgi:hypothetical protein
MSETPKKRRRWLQFSLGSFLLVTTIVGSLVGSVLHTLKERERVVALLESQGGYAEARWHPNDPKGHFKQLPFMMKLLGATAYDFIRMPGSIYHSKASGAYDGFEGYVRLEALFPEARIVVSPIDPASITAESE